MSRIKWRPTRQEAYVGGVALFVERYDTWFWCADMGIDGRSGYVKTRRIAVAKAECAALALLKRAGRKP